MSPLNKEKMAIQFRFFLSIAKLGGQFSQNLVACVGFAHIQYIL
jgi:hypothetical protein